MMHASAGLALYQALAGAPPRSRTGPRSRPSSSHASAMLVALFDSLTGWSLVRDRFAVYGLLPWPLPASDRELKIRVRVRDRGTFG